MHDWIIAGMVIGIKAFTAVCVFGALCAALIGLLGLLAVIAKGLGDGKDK